MSNRVARRRSAEDSGHDEPASPSTVGGLNPSTRLLHSQQRSPVASRNASISGPDHLPAWTRGTSISLHARTSRASSIMSTGTRVSIDTAHDEDRHTHEASSPSGGERYWLGLDGQIVSTRAIDVPQPPNQVEVPRPPYQEVVTQREISRREHVLPPPQQPKEEKSITVDKLSPPDLAEHPAFASSSSLPASEAVGVQRNPSFTPGKEKITVKKHGHSNSVTSLNAGQRAASPDASPNTTPLKRVGGVRLRVLTHTGQSGTGLSPLTPNSGLSSSSVYSQPPSAGAEGGPEDHSPIYYGISACGIFPSPSDLRVMNGGYGKVDLEEGKALLTPDLSLEKRRPRRGSESPAALRRQRPIHELRSVSKDSGVDDLGIETPNPYVSVSAPAELEGSPCIPLSNPAELEGSPSVLLSSAESGPDKDFCAHCTHIVQALDRRGRVDSPEGSRFICDLAQQVLALKTELKRTKQDLHDVQRPLHTAQKDSNNIGLIDSLFPPMKLRHVNTLKRAMQRRAAKVRSKPSPLSQVEPTAATTTSSSPVTGATDYSDVHPAYRLPRTPPPRTAQKSPPSSKSSPEPPALRTALHTVQIQNLALTTSIRGLETELSDLKSSLAFWADRSAKLETTLTTSEQNSQKREEELKERMCRIDEQGRGLVERAVRERDEEWANEWARKNKAVLERLKIAEAAVVSKVGDVGEMERTLRERLDVEVKARERAEKQVKDLEERLLKLENEKVGKVGEVEKRSSSQVANSYLSPDLSTGGPVSPALSTGSGMDGIDTWIDAMDGCGDGSPRIQ